MYMHASNTGKKLQTGGGVGKSHCFVKLRDSDPVRRIFEPRHVEHQHQVSVRMVATDRGEMAFAGLAQSSSEI